MTDPKIPLYAVHFSDDVRPPLGVGMIVANIKANYPHLAERLDFSPGYVATSRQLWARYGEHGSGIFLFSSYMWNSAIHLDIGRRLKQRNPNCFAVFGGPSVPRYPAACSDFLNKHPYVDVVCHGEGEVTTAEVLERWTEEADLTPVHGVAFLRDGEVVLGPPRERERHLDRFPSPYLTGEFDARLGRDWSIATLETNRGCPYGCTFCDWGQATLQRINLFSMERVTADIGHVVSRGVEVIELADANFGIFERDFEIARIVARSGTAGRLREFRANHAKNATPRVSNIVRLMRDAGMVSRGMLSVQTNDGNVLRIIDRENIKPAKYDALLQEFRKQALPVHTEIMMGLPGSTYETFTRDLQWACDKNLGGHISWTMVLPNTPMADPAYIEAHAIKTAGESAFLNPTLQRMVRARALRADTIVSTRTFGEEDFLKMARLSALFHLFHGESVLKYLMFYLRWSRDVPHIAFLERLRDDSLDAYPLLRCLRDWKASFEREDVLLGYVADNRWPDFYAEMKRYVEIELSLPCDSELSTVFASQQFVMAYTGRVEPQSLVLKHDFPRYFLDVVSDGIARRLGEYGPAVLTIRDLNGACRLRPGAGYEPHCGMLELASSFSEDASPSAPASRTFG
jgi:radical SAM superfamily enzyme YgiQ (UPF0313 family)